MAKEHLLKKGDIFLLEEGHSFYIENFPQAFLYDNGDFNFELTSGEIHIRGIRRGLDTSIFCGRYVVTDIQMTGGSHGRDDYPDGHQVSARKIIKGLDGKKTTSHMEIRFYQTGVFTCKNTRVHVVGRAKLKTEITF